MTNIFNSAKIKLTGLYLIIIMLVTVSFSLFIYTKVNDATEHALDMQKHRIERVLDEVPPAFRDQIDLSPYKRMSF
jgi:hypothetical protein